MHSLRLALHWFPVKASNLSKHAAGRARCPPIKAAQLPCQSQCLPSMCDIMPVFALSAHFHLPLRSRKPSTLLQDCDQPRMFVTKARIDDKLQGNKPPCFLMA